MMIIPELDVLQSSKFIRLMKYFVSTERSRLRMKLKLKTKVECPSVLGALHPVSRYSLLPP